MNNRPLSNGADDSASSRVEINRCPLITDDGPVRLHNLRNVAPRVILKAVRLLIGENYRAYNLPRSGEFSNCGASKLCRNWDGFEIYVIGLQRSIGVVNLIENLVRGDLLCNDCSANAVRSSGRDSLAVSTQIRFSSKVDKILAKNFPTRAS